MKFFKFIFVFLLLISFQDVFAWPITEQNLDNFYKYVENYKKKEINVNVLEKYEKSNEIFDKKDIKLIVDQLNYLSEAEYINCVSKYLEIFNKEKNNQKREVYPVFLNLLDETLDLCVNKRNLLQDLANNIKNNKVNSSFEKLRNEINDRIFNQSKIYLQQYTVNLDDVQKGLKPRYMKSNNNRELAKNDVVAQILTYSIGMSENASGSAYFYPVNNKNGACIYKLEIDKSDQMTSLGVDYVNQIQNTFNSLGLSSTINPGQQQNWFSDDVDLNKFNLKNVKFYQIQSNQGTRNSGRTANLSYVTQVEGLTQFECDSTVCNIDRLKNGWKILLSKCKGSTKAF